ncbi:MAG: hypothetical protein KTR31_34935 [Myxococcales bacterium]|nr:hypothetical protein [Myxococcales bacterium]
MSRFWVMPLFVALAASCGGDKDTDVADVDVDTDADTDADADSDTDSDADTDTTPKVDCADVELADGVPDAVVDSTQSEGDDLAGSCGGDGDADVAFRFVAPFAGDFGFVVPAGAAFDSVLYALDECGGTELQCADVAGNGGEQLRLTLGDGDEVIVVVDGGEGAFDLEVREAFDTEQDCLDGFDDDFDGDLDCDDADCSKDASCLLYECVDVVATGTLPETFVGSTLGNDDDEEPSCDYGYGYYKKKGGDGGDDQVLYTALQAGSFVFDTVGSDFDTVLSILDSCGGKELGCNDQWIDNDSQLVVTLAAGEAIVVNVDGWAGAEGDYVLNVAELQANELDCADGRDLDDDGDVDCFDADCVGVGACLEICDNGIDDNKDFLIDCQDLLGCGKDPACQPTCPDTLAAGSLPETLAGVTLGAFDELTPSCGYKLASGDHQIEYLAPETGDYVFDTVGSDYFTLLSIVDACGGTEVACDSGSVNGLDSQVVQSLTAGQSVIVNVDGVFGGGDFVLNVDRLEAAESVCDDGRDLDDDGDVDCFDTDCEDDAVCVEICDNNVDDNGTGLVDCQEAQCSKDKACLPQCPDESEDTVPATLVGETIGDTDEVTQSCTAKKGGGPDVQVEFTAPTTGDFVFDTVGSDYDTGLSLLDACGGTELACNDDYDSLQSHLSLSMTKGDTVIVDVDGYSDLDSGNFVLNVAEVEAVETDCADGRDLDDDGDIDCADTDCAKDPSC